MTFWTAGAAIGGAGMGAVASNNAADNGAKARKDGQEILEASQADSRQNRNEYS